MKKFELTQPNGNPKNRSVSITVWYTISKVVPLILIILGLLGYLWGFNKKLIIAGEDIKLIQPIAKTVESQGYEIASMKKAMEDIPVMKADIVQTKEGIARMEGKLDILIKRK